MYSLDNLCRNTIAMVLAGGKGERLSPLTLRRAKPSVSRKMLHELMNDFTPPSQAPEVNRARA